MKKNLETTKRRFDWVTALGVILFVAIVIAEITVAVGVPLLVRQEGVMAERVVKLTTLDLFDSTRRASVRTIKSATNDLIRAEAKVVDDTLSILASYMRDNVDHMSTEQFKMVQDRTKLLRGMLIQLEKQRAYSSRTEINLQGALKALATPAAAQ